MKKLLLILTLLNAVSEVPVQAQSGKQDQLILVVNCFDVSGTRFRNNKKELLAGLADSIRFQLSEKINVSGAGKAVNIEQTVSTAMIDSLLRQHDAAAAIAILNIAPEFEQKEVNVERASDGSKKRTARYDLCSSVIYMLITRNGSTNEREERNCEFFTERTVMSGLLAAGPDLVGKSKWVYRSVGKNVTDYFEYIIPFLQ
jgi:hypothetical protein